MSKRKIIVNIVTACLLTAIAIGAFVMANRSRPNPQDLPPALPEGMEYSIGNTVAIGHFENMDDMEFIVDDWDGEYDLQFAHGPDAQLVWYQQVLDYTAYREFCSNCRTCGVTQTYDDPSARYIVYGVTNSIATDYQARLAAVEYDGDTAHLYLWSNVNFDPEQTQGASYLIVVPTNKDVDKIVAHPLQTLDDYQWYAENDEPEPEPEKPILYLYPEQETDVSVTLGHPACVTHSYPKYDGPWRVKARPDGTLTDLETGRELYSLYYENVSPIPLPQTDEGFVVRGGDTAAFLEEKLAILGLTPREAEEFIVYWLPRLEENKWNYIRFADRAEIDAEMPLDISPQPDSLIRVLMLWKPLDAPIEVREQTLTAPARTGFTAVEWGGAELDNAAAS